MKKLIFTILAAAMIITAVACAPQETDDTAGIRGEVREINTGKGNIVILVEGEKTEDTEYDKAYVTINADTKVIRAEGGKETPADLLDINLFDVVEVVFNRPVAESYPVQGKAKLVRILGE
jgi:beta-N-acetylhexosaminidase